MSILVDFILGTVNLSYDKYKILQREMECLVDIVLVLQLGAGSLHQRGPKSYPFVLFLSTPTVSDYFSLGFVNSQRAIFSVLESSC